MQTEPTQTPLACAILVMLEYLRLNSPNGESICHTPTGILEFLKLHGGEAANAPGFPATPEQMGRALSQIEPELKAQKIIVKADKCRTFGRLWTIAREVVFRPAPTARRMKAESMRIYGR